MQPPEDLVFRHRRCPVNDHLSNLTPVMISVA